MENVILNKQLTRLGYSLHSLRDDPCFDLTMIEGTCVLTNNNVLLIGDSITGIAKNKKLDKSIVFTNREDIIKEFDKYSGKKLDEAITRYTESLYKSNILFFESLIDLLVNKSKDKFEKSEQFKSAVLNLSSDDFSMKISISSKVSAFVVNKKTGDTMVLQSLDAIKALLRYVKTITSIEMLACTAKGTRRVTVEGILPYIFKELIFYFNRTIIAEYMREDGTIQKLYIFDKHVVDVTEPNGNSVAIITYSINKLPEIYPVNIYIESVSYKEVIERIEDSVRMQGFTPIKVRR